MKKITILILTLHLVSVCLYAQKETQAKLLEEFKTKNQRLVALFKEGEYKKAQKFAIEALDLAKKVFAKDEDQLASSYLNLAETYRMRRKFDNAIENFSFALAILEKKEKPDVPKIIDVLESRGTAFAFDGDKKKAEKDFTKAIELAEQIHGTESAELLPFLKKQADFYIFTKDFDKADEVFIRRRVIAIKTSKDLSSESSQNQSDELTCYLFSNVGFSGMLERQRKISEAVAVATKEFSRSQNKDGVKKIGGGVINGKAINLAEPDYPMLARNNGIRGSVLVKVVVDTEGKVSEASAICGHKYLRDSSEIAAKRSRFQPTLLDGEPVEVSGLIVYTYN